MFEWTKYDSQKLLAVGLIVAGYLLWPKDSKRPVTVGVTQK